MFARRKQNRNGTTSVHVIDKSHKSYHVVKSFGVGHSEVEICRLEEKARQYILERQGLANGLFEEKLITFKCFIHSYPANIAKFVESYTNVIK